MFVNVVSQPNEMRLLVRDASKQSIIFAKYRIFIVPL